MFQTCINIFRSELLFALFLLRLLCNIENMLAYVFIPITTPSISIIAVQAAAAAAPAPSNGKVCKVHSLEKFLLCSLTTYHNVHSMQNLTIKHQVSNELRVANMFVANINVLLYAVCAIRYKFAQNSNLLMLYDGEWKGH